MIKYLKKTSMLLLSFFVLFSQFNGYCIAGVTFAAQSMPLADDSALTYRGINIPADAAVLTPDIVSKNVYTANVYERPRWSNVTANDLTNSINVKDCGAVGDGVTDDSNAIDSALAQAKAAVEKKVYFPEGNYLISKEFVLDYTYSGIKIYGAGSNTIITLTGSTAGNIFTVSDYVSGTNNNIDNIEIANLKIIGNKGVSYAGGFGIDTFMNGSGKINNLNIHDIESSDFITNGIQLEDCYDAKLNNIWSHDNACHGIGLKCGTYSIDNIWVYNNTQLGIDFSGADLPAQGEAGTIFAYNNKDGGGKTAGLWDIHIKKFVSLNNAAEGFKKTAAVNKISIDEYISNNNGLNGYYFGANNGSDKLQIGSLYSYNDNTLGTAPGGAVYLASKGQSAVINYAVIEETSKRAITIEMPNVQINNLTANHTKTTTDYPVRVQGSGGVAFGNCVIYNGDNASTPIGIYLCTSNDVTFSLLKCGDNRIPPIMTQALYIDTTNTGNVTINSTDFSQCNSTKPITDRTGGSKTIIGSPAVNVTGISVSPAGILLKRNDTCVLTASVSPANALNKYISWTSSDITVATVDSKGNIKAVSAGKADVTVTTSDGNYSAVCSVTVDTASPVLPDNKAVKASDISQTGATLTWEKSTDDNTTEDKLVYCLFSSNSDSLTSLSDITASIKIDDFAANVYSKTITGLMAGTTCYFYVVVKDEAGNMSAYNVSKVQTVNAPPVGNGNTMPRVDLTLSGIKDPATGVTQSPVIIANQTNTNAVKNVIITLDTVTITAPASVLNDALGASSQNTLRLTQAAPSEAIQALTAAAAESNKSSLIGVIELVLTRYNSNGTTEQVHQLSGNITVSIKLTDEQLERLKGMSNPCLYYYNPDTKSLANVNAVFDMVNGTATFAINHLSTFVIAADAPANIIGVSYSSHVQSAGWQQYVSNGAVSGTTGRALRLEALNIRLTGSVPIDAKITCQVHMQSIGWQKPVSDGAQAGSTGKKLRIEAVKITISGLKGYQVRYRVHVQSKGWKPWQISQNGTSIEAAGVAGTTGLKLRIEAIQVVVEKI